MVDLDRVYDRLVQIALRLYAYLLKGCKLCRAIDKKLTKFNQELRQMLPQKSENYIPEDELYPETIYLEPLDPMDVSLY